jgi:TonB family protein
MENSRKHGMFNQNLKNLRQHSNRINLARLAQDSFLVGASLTQKNARDAGCYLWDIFKKVVIAASLFTILSCASTPDKSREGWVRLSFDISETGNPINIKVIEANPERIFDNAAIKALTKWKYRPKFINGVAVIQRDLEVHLDFKLDETNN